jgi:hypothetical protein
MLLTICDFIIGNRYKLWSLRKNVNSLMSCVEAVATRLKAEEEERRMRDEYETRMAQEEEECLRVAAKEATGGLKVEDEEEHLRLEAEDLVQQEEEEPLHIEDEANTRLIV